MRVRAKQYMYYNRREYKAGEEYEMDDREETTAKLLQALGKIEIVTASVPVAMPPVYHTTEVKSEEETPLTTEDAAPLLGRRYRRRDMRPIK